jgi:hypothetical protein
VQFAEGFITKKSIGISNLDAFVLQETWNNRLFLSIQHLIWKIVSKANGNS